jgi:16S rRNA (guanine966-N2)-methyltransferase
MILLGGKFKGRKLKAPRGTATRPTTSLVRKAVFDICQFFIEDAHFLDLFAGSGAMGFEALSRGASKITLIEQNENALRALKENIALLNCAAQTQLLRGNSLVMMKKLKEPFDIIYIDPPYGALSLTEILSTIDTLGLLKPEGHLFIEALFPSAELLEETPLQHLKFKDKRRLGTTLVYHFFS